MKTKNHRVLIYRNKPIRISETFIYNQSIRLNRYKAYILGCKEPEGNRIQIPENQLKLINEGGILGLVKESLFKIFGIIPINIFKWVKNIRPDLIHAHFGDDGAIAIPLARAMRIPFIVSFLGTDATLKDEYARKSYFRKRLYLLRRKKLARSVTKVIVPSQFLMDEVIKQGFPKGKIQIIHHGVDLSVFDNLKSKPIYGQILFVGRLVPRKGLNFLISALKSIKPDFPEINLTVIGDGPYRKQFESQARQDLVNGFEFLGFQPHTIVNEYLSRSYLFSMPSITMPSGEAETFGLVFIEAQAMGVPVVSFDTGGIPEVVDHGNTGFLAEEGDIQGLAKYLKILLENSQLRNEMGQNGVAHVRRHFSLEKQNHALEQFYDQVLSGQL